jgi:hypothetical protein
VPSPSSSPPSGFLQQLIDLEKEVHGKATMGLGKWGTIQWL